MAINKAALKRNISFGSYFFLLGVEYAVILPTVNGYLITLQADTTFLGIVLASFSFAGLVTAPLYGYITDKTGSAKGCIIVGNLLEIVGNFLYFVGENKYFIWLGRIIAGLGSGAGSSVLGTVSKSTSSQARTSSFALLMALRQIGLVIGPALNAFLCVLNFQLGPFVVDANSSPGLFMALLWLLHTLLILILYRSSPQSIESRPSEDVIADGTVKMSRSLIIKAYVKTLLHEEVVVLLACSFLSMFIQTGMETAITPMTLMYFGWQGLGNSFLLLGCGLLVIASFLSLHFCSKFFSDRALLLFGCITLTLSYAVFLASAIILKLSNATVETPPWVLPVFFAYMLLWVLAAAYLFVPQISLFSKVTGANTQGLNQGIRIVITRLGMILGPLWAGPMVTNSRLPILAGTSLAILCLLMAMIVGSYKRFLPAQSPESSVSRTGEPAEYSPLLSNA